MRRALEYEPVFLHNDNAIEFAFARGDQRAATGSHYTPDDLVQPLIKHSLDYLIADRLKASNPEAALLSLRVADISCGSGHILLAAARRIATELAIVRTGEEQPSPSAFRSAIRDVIRNCIYGVDLNPLAVELCKVALWLEAHIPGQPLNFLDHHIKCGNAIVGFAHREEMQKGVPDEAFVTMPGDDKEVVAELRKRNKAERIRQGKQVSFSFTPEIDQSFSLSLKQWHEIALLPERTPSEIEEKKRRYQAFATGKDSSLLRQIASIPIAQFYIEKTYGNRSSIITDDEYSQYLSGQQSPNEQATAMVQAIAERKNFFNWFLEFPEIIENGGFDCILGNPPYLGGQALSGTYGAHFCEYVKWEYAPTGLSELVVFFIRRIYSLLQPEGFTAFITTNSITDGNVRKDGLEQVLAQNGSINFAVRGIKWPGRANLVVSLVGLYKEKWQGKYNLDGRSVPVISAYFEDSLDDGELLSLFENKANLFQGSIFLGEGFLLTHEEAHHLIMDDARNKEVIYPVTNGQEINNEPNQRPQRSIINFFTLTEEEASTYSRPFEIIREKVKPVRMKLNPSTQVNQRRRNYWWQFGALAANLYVRINLISHCFVAAATTKYLNFSALQTNYVFTHALYVFSTDRWDLYSIVQSTIHEVWARKYSGSLETRLRYSPTDCFETYAFPESLWQVPNQILATTGEHYHEYRHALMLRFWLGLTDIYNLFHNRDLTPAIVAKVSGKPDEAESGYAGILELRKLHRELDEAVLAAYTWSDLNLAHDFYEIETLPENDRVRYTISPEARKELLKRLLALNHQRAAEEKANAPAKAVKQGKGKGTKRNNSTQEGPGLFG